jgi:hypothetical protein
VGGRESGGMIEKKCHESKTKNGKE